ncbi:hypothetical protein HYH03_016565 [Edaphochlamys debaryana]|uniref:cyclin-dependent kinase n=1 Tax=Edaphochlamys debaryana TaxID=47281 RepID=A0A835XLV1_9CHLO|nr:hypothetical protein HYH03_016565 [Edaphochlamys debaryana]|eukprot:KAG2484611.1 hypothetical protein HYH03_016565 [Edaphochlamys debaryana]
MTAEPPVTAHKVAEDYEFLESLGRGAYGSVWRCIQRHTGADVAVKGFKRTAGNPEELLRLALREVRLLRSLDHPAVIRLVEAFKGRSGRVFMVFPYVGPSAFQVLEAHPRGLPPRTLLLVAWQLAQGLAYLHGRKVVHRDLKPANVLMGEGGVARLCDFGFARRTACGPRDDQTLTPYTVTRWYRPPEVLLGCPYGPAADVWSLGCTLAELATGKPLFPGTSSADQMALIRECLVLRGQAAGGEGLRARLPHLQPALFTLIEGCVSMDPMQRSTAEELLRMPYLSDMHAVLEGTALAAEYDEHYERRRRRHEARRHQAAEQDPAADHDLTADHLVLRDADLPDPNPEPGQEPRGPNGHEWGFQLSQQESHDGPEQPTARLFVFPEGGRDADTGPTLGSGSHACDSASAPFASASASASTPFASASASASAGLVTTPCPDSSAYVGTMGGSARLCSAPQLDGQPLRLCVVPSPGQASRSPQETQSELDPAAGMAEGASRAAAAATHLRLGPERARAASDCPPSGTSSPVVASEAGEWRRDGAHRKQQPRAPSNGRGYFSFDARGAATHSSSDVAAAAADLMQRSPSTQPNLHLAASPRGAGGGGSNSGRGRSPSLPPSASLPPALGAAAWGLAATSSSGHVNGSRGAGAQSPAPRAMAAPPPRTPPPPSKSGTGWRTAADRAAATAAGRPPPLSSAHQRSTAESFASQNDLGARSNSVGAGSSGSQWGQMRSPGVAGGRRSPSVAAGPAASLRPSASAVRSPLSRPSPVGAVQSSIQATLMAARPPALSTKDSRNSSLSGVPECRTPPYAQPPDPLCSETLPRVRPGLPASTSLAESLSGTVSRRGLSPGPSPSPAAGSALADVPGSAGPELFRTQASIDLGGEVITTLIGTADEPWRQQGMSSSGLDWQPPLQARPSNPLAAAAPSPPVHSASTARLALRAGASSGRRTAGGSSSSGPRASWLASGGGGGGGGGVLGGVSGGGVSGLAQLALVEVDEESPYNSAARAGGKGGAGDGSAAGARASDGLSGPPAPAEGPSTTHVPVLLPLAPASPLAGAGGGASGNLSGRFLGALQAIGLRMGSVAGEASPRSSGQFPAFGSALSAGPSGTWANPAPCPAPPTAAAASRAAAAVPPPPARRAGLRSPVTRFGTSGDGAEPAATPAADAVPAAATAVAATARAAPAPAQTTAAGMEEHKGKGLFKRFVKAVKRTFAKAADN